MLNVWRKIRVKALNF